MPILLLFLLFFITKYKNSYSCQISTWKSTNDSVLKPLSDERKFKSLVLENGITALLVEENKSEKAGFSVGVKVGSFNDPPYAQGLFHLMEHMLFLGTEKFSEPKNYDEFMSRHGGRNNAYTSEERTIYFNEITEEYLESGLNHFSQFFISPLLKEEMVFKEINSINSEHSKNIPNELDRLWNIVKSYTYPPFSKFTTGNFETLINIPNSLNISLPELLKKMYLKYYCGKNIFVVISSRKKLIEQEKLLKKYFSNVSIDNNGVCLDNNFKNKNLPIKSLVKKEYLGKFLHVKSLMGRNLLWLVWSFSKDFNSISKQPLAYLSYILNSKFQNRLIWILQKENYILDANSMYENYNFASIFIYQIILTRKGLRNIDKVIGFIYKYINKLKKSDALLNIYQGIKSLSEREFSTQMEMSEKSPMYTVSEICSRMVQYGVHNALSGDLLIKEIDENLIKRVLNHISPYNTLFLLQNDFEISPSNVLEDEYFHVKHTIENIPESTLKKWARGEFSKNVDVDLPIPENCSPLNLKIIEDSNDSTYPELLKSNLANIWWHRQTIKNHRIRMKLLLKYPRRYNRGVKTQVWGTLITHLLNLLLEDKIEKYRECGMNIDVLWETEGISIDIDTFGYSNDLSIVLNEIIASSFKKINEIECSSLKDIVYGIAESNKSFHIGEETAYSQALRLIKSLQFNEEYTEWELRYYLNQLISNKIKQSQVNSSFLTLVINYINTMINLNQNDKSNELCKFLNNWNYRILHRVSVLAYVQGNITKNKALQLIEGFVINSNVLPLNKKYSISKKVRNIKNSVDITLINPILNDENNTVLTLYQFGIPTFEEKIHLMALEPLIQGYIYEDLRTKKQIGYIVLASMIPIGNVKALVIGVEGDKKYSVENIEMNIYQNLYDFSIEELGKMKTNTFEDIKLSLLKELESIDNSFSLSFRHYWDEIRFSKDFSQAFNLKKAIEYINNTMTIEQLYNTFNKLVGEKHIKPAISLKITSNFNNLSLSKKQESRDEYVNLILTTIRESLKREYF